MVIQSREEFGKERGSNLLGTEKRLEEDTYITSPSRGGRGAAYFGKRKSREKWSGKRKSFQNHQQPATEIGALPVENSTIIYCISQVLHFLTESVRYFAIFLSYMH